MHSIRFMPDDQLLRQCRVEITRGSGPGGQKRNKTSNSVRLTHQSSGISVIAGESRSQQVNKLHAMRRLRLKLATEIREPIELQRFEPPDWFLEVRHQNRIETSYKHRFYAPVAGLILDLLAALHGSPADVAGMLGISTTAVIRFLENEPVLWTAANRIRSETNLPPLTHRK
jgi:hypothetical protein